VTASQDCGFRLAPHNPSETPVRAGSRNTRQPSGFTLVEVLVTLVLLSMVAAVAFGSLRQVLEARDRLRPYLDRSQETTLVAGWFRQTIQALIADYDQGRHRFSGTAREISGLTTSPLVGPAGTPTAFRWAISYDPTRDLTTLGYEERPGQTLRIAEWAGQAGAFAYYAGEQKWQPAWPPSATDQGKSISQLPSLVRLSGAPRDTVPLIIAAPRASPVAAQPPPNLLGPSLLGN
jgi:prepilin-type N-terminal cleavage/methylation domain-containing protein